MSRGVRLACPFTLLLAACATSPRGVAHSPERGQREQPRGPVGVREEDYWKRRTDLICPPAGVSAVALRVPGLKRVRLPNGVTLLLLPDRTLPLADLQVVFRTGAIDDPPDKVGLAEFGVRMLRHGTERMDADTLSETIDRAGAVVSASPGYELSSVGCHARSRDLGLCLQVVADMVMRPTFPEKEMNEIRDKLLGAVKQTRDDPAALAEQHFNNLLYGDEHPAGRPMTAETLAGIARADLQEFRGQRLVPEGTVIGLSGDIDAETARAKLEQAFGAWSPRRPPVRPGEVVKDPPAGLRVLLVDKPDLSQSFFALGHAGIRRTDPDRDAVLVANYVLGGGGFSSRLTTLVRSKGGKTYGIRSQFDQGIYDGSFVVQSFTRNDQLVPMLRLVQEELARLARDPPSETEVRGAKGDMAGGYSIRLDTSAQILGRLVRAEAWGLPGTFVTEYPVRVERLTRDVVGRAARAHVRPGHLVAAVVGKAAVVGPALRAAKVPFEQVSYLDPISAADRRSRRVEEKVSISEAEMKEARPVLERALRAAGGRERLSLVRSLRLGGRGQVEEVEGNYQVLLLLPDHLRLTFDFKQGAMVQVLAGQEAFVQAGGERKKLPAEVRDRMRGLIWRDPVLLPLHALDQGVQYRPSKDPALVRGRDAVAIDLFPEGLPPATVVIDRGTGHLMEIRYRSRSGQLRVTTLSEHRKALGGVLVPRRVVEVNGRRRQSVSYTVVEINPRISQREIVDARPRK
jgi:zinc protease